MQAIAAKSPHRRRAWALFGLVMATFVAGFVNALQHAKDAGATMPVGLTLSVVVFIMATVSIGYGFVATRVGEPT